MLCYEVLNKREKEVWRIISFIEKNRKFDSLEYLCEKSEMTNFTFWSRIQVINEDWLQLFGEPLFSTRTTEICELTATDIQINVYRQYLLQNSIGNKLLLAYLFDDFELELFVKTHRLSQATVYRVRKEVQAALTPYNIQIKQNKLIGDERIIRDLLMTVLDFRNLNIDDLLTRKQIRSIRKFMDELIATYDLVLKPIEAARLKYCLAVTIKRAGAEDTIQVEIPIVWKETEKVIFMSFRKFFEGSTKDTRAEFEMLMAYLYGFGLIADLQFERSSFEAKVHFLTLTFQTKVYPLLKLTNLDSETAIELDKRMLQIHWRNMLFPYYVKSNGSSEMMISENDIFYQIFEVIEECYRQVGVFEEMGNLIISEHRQMLYDYFFILMDYLNQSNSLPKVNICVDLSNNSIPFWLFQQFFSSSWFSNVKIQEKVDGDTDIYLSDQMIDEPMVPKRVVWLRAPHYSEIFELAAEIYQIALNKYHQTAV